MLVRANKCHSVCLTTIGNLETLLPRSGEPPLEKPLAAYDGDEAYVFVCHAHEDSTIVYPEINWLHEQGVNLWYDEGISAGKNWRAAIGDSLLGASQPCPLLHLGTFAQIDPLQS